MIPSSSRRVLADGSTVWNASENREYRPKELLLLPLLWPSASLPIVDCRPPMPALVSCHIPRPRKGDHGSC
jgi:hypothetical protein